MITSTLLQEVSITFSKKDAGEPQFVRSSIDAYTHAKTFWGSSLEICESMFVLYLNNSNKVIGYSKIMQGGITFGPVDLRLIFAEALACLATNIIIMHNHPSGKLKPSTADIKTTDRIKEAGQILDIILLDHLIITDSGYFSFADESCL